MIAESCTYDYRCINKITQVYREHDTEKPSEGTTPNTTNPASEDKCCGPTTTISTASPPRSEDQTADPILKKADPPQQILMVISIDPCRLHHIITIILTLSDACSLEDQLFNDNLLRLWRTGAGQELYLSEEDGDVDVSAL